MGVLSMLLTEEEKQLIIERRRRTEPFEVTASRIVVERLKKSRLLFKIRQGEIAKRMGVSQSQLSHIENGSNGSNPSLHTVFRLCKALQVDPSEIFKGLVDVNHK